MNTIGENKNKYKIYIVALVLLLCTRVFGAIDLPINLITLVIVSIYSVSELTKPSPFKKPIVLIFWGLLVSAISCEIYRGQSIQQSLIASGNILYLALFFFLKKIDLSIRQCELIIYWLGIFFCICYILQFIVLPLVIFDGASVVHDDPRIRLGGQGILFLAFFFVLNKSLLQFKLIHLILLTLAVIVVLLMGFRTMMLSIFILSLFLMYKINGIGKKNILILFISMIAGIIILQLPVIQEKMILLVARNETQNFANEDYVRILNIQYFLSEHFISMWEWIWGSGMPSHESQYGSQYFKNAGQFGYIFEDIGLWGLSWVVGIIPVICMLWFAIKCIVMKVSLEYKYISFFYLFLLLSSFTTSEFYRAGNFVIHAFTLYIANKYLENSTYEKNRNSNIS